jgi:hypothetical protein
MKLLKHLQTLWRKAFPVRVVTVYRDRVDGIPSVLNEFGEVESFDSMLPELIEAYTTCSPIFKWLAMEVAQKDKMYHALPPVDAVKYEEWKRTIEGLNIQIATLNKALRIPLIANRRIIELQKLTESRKVSESERKALEDLFE